MHTITHKFVVSIAQLSAALFFATSAGAEEANPIPEMEPPLVAAPAQRWLSHQDWHCLPNKSYDPKKYILDIRARMNTLGQLGWEVVNFTQVAIANKSCYVVTFKTPYQLSK
jgi:hypothetical protein